MNILGLKPEHVAEMWPVLKWAFDSFAERGDTPAHEYLADVLEKRAQCWVAYDGKVRAVALTKKTDKAVTMTHCAGEGREDWQVQLVDEIRAWARHEGVGQFRAVCRPGWARMLKAQGMRETHRLMEQNIE